MSWDPTRLLSNCIYRGVVRLTKHDPQMRAMELAQSMKHSADGWCPDIYTRMTRSTLKEIGNLDTKFSETVQKTLAVKADAKTTAAVYRQALVGISLNYGGSPGDIAGLVARMAVRNLQPEQKQAVESAFKIPERVAPQTEAERHLERLANGSWY